MEEIRVQVTAAGIPPRCSGCGDITPVCDTSSTVIALGSKLVVQLWSSLGFSAMFSGGFRVKTNVVLFGEELPSEA